MTLKAFLERSGGLERRLSFRESNMPETGFLGRTLLGIAVNRGNPRDNPSPLTVIEGT